MFFGLIEVFISSFIMGSYYDDSNWVFLVIFLFFLFINGLYYLYGLVLVYRVWF